jgi:hypothetical protein
MLNFSRTKLVSGIALAVTALASLPLAANAGSLNSNAPTVALSAKLDESLSLSIVNGTVGFTLSNGTTTAGDKSVAITSKWTLLPTRTSVKVYGSFADSTAALTDGSSNNITSANVLGKVSTGTPTAFTAFSQSGPFGGAGASLLLVNQAISASTPNFVGTRTDNLDLEISTPSDLPAGTYAGTLTLQAQAN